MKERLSTILNEKLEKFNNKLFFSKNDKLEAVVIPINEYERLKEVDLLNDKK